MSTSPSSSFPASYRRILIKLSGEALGGESGIGLNHTVVEGIAQKIATLHTKGFAIGIVVGGGNIMRGAEAARGFGRAAGDAMGILATTINSLAIQDALQNAGVPTQLYSAVDMPKIAPVFTQNTALADMQAGRVVIIGGGTGNPYFTTDAAAILRALELECNCMIKATKVDGVYDCDPKKYPDAKRFESLSLDEALAQNLRVMDLAAIAFARDEKMPVFVCHIDHIDALGTDDIVGTFVRPV